MASARNTAASPLESEFRKHNLGWFLLRISQDFFSKVVGEFSTRGHTGLRPSHATVLAHLPFEGARITELAASVGVTKQAIGLAVDELERLGYVERVADPGDGRAKLVRFTSRGRAFLRDSERIVSNVWEEYGERLGHARLERLRTDLEALLETIEPETRNENEP